MKLTPYDMAVVDEFLERAMRYKRDNLSSLRLALAATKQKMQAEADATGEEMRQEAEVTI